MSIRQVLAQSPDELVPFVSPFLTLPLRSRAQVLEDIERGRSRVHRRETREKATPR